MNRVKYKCITVQTDNICEQRGQKLSNKLHSTHGIYLLVGEEIPYILETKNIHSVFTTAMLMLITIFTCNQHDSD